MSLRIVSLIVSATEMVAALGLADRLVCVSHECDWPPEAVAGRPVLTRAKVMFNSRACGVEGEAPAALPLEGATRAPVMDVTRQSCDIHADVQEIVRRGHVYIIDGNTYMNRPGPRIVESFYLLAGLLHPQAFGQLIPTHSVAQFA